MSVYVIGASGHGKVVLATLEAAGVPVAGVLDDDPARHGGHLLGIPVLGSVDVALSGDHPVVLAVGSNAARKRIAERLGEGVPWATAVHPRAVVHPTVRIGGGTVIFAGAVVQPDTVVGRHVIVNTGATVDHDGWLGDYVHVAPGVHLAGAVHLAEGVFVGVGGCAIQGVRVGAWTTVGAGGVVTRGLPAGVTAVGVPARPLAR